MPTSVYRCLNQSCPHHGVDRSVAVTEVGDGLLAEPSIRCVCGWFPQRVGRNPDKATANPPAHPSPSGSRKAVRTPPATRAKRR